MRPNTTVAWERYPHIAESDRARAWLILQDNLRLSPATVDAYGRALEGYLAFSQERHVEADTARKDHVARFVRHLLSHEPRRGRRQGGRTAPSGLANATIQQRLTAVRLYYDYLSEEGVRPDNPVGRGRYTPGKGYGGHQERGLLPRFHKLPWIPGEDEWKAVLAAARDESPRNRLMLALAYDAALRRSELCGVQTGDLDPAHRLLRVRAESSKSGRERVVPYSEPTGALLGGYLARRRELSRERGPLFLSESRRNRAQPVTIWTWSKVVEGVAARAGVERFTTHTPRHLCLTDLARAGWDVHEIATFAGHRSIQSTLLYIHLSGRELAAKLEAGMAEIHAWRVQAMGEALR